MTVLKSIRFAGLGLAALVVLGPTGSAQADVEYPYCLVPSLFTVGTCYYTTLEQCMAAASGNIGTCERNPRYVAPPMRQLRSKR